MGDYGPSAAHAQPHLSANRTVRKHNIKLLTCNASHPHVVKDIRTSIANGLTPTRHWGA